MSGGRTMHAIEHEDAGAGAAARRDIAIRWLLAGPVALGAAVLVMAAMPLWLPRGAGGIDHLAFPLILFPAVWGVLFFYALLAENLARATLVLLAVLAANGAPVALVLSAAEAANAGAGAAP